MGYDLSNASGGYVRFSGSGWDLALAIARHYGWEPAGIPKPEWWDETDGPWEDEYWINAGQQVTSADACALAGALERAIASTDFIDSLGKVKNDLNDTTTRCNPQWRDELRPLSREEAETFRAHLNEFVAFARQGPFSIE